MITRRLFAVTATVLLTATVVHVGPAAAGDGATAHRLAVTPTSLHRTVTHQVQDLPQHSIGVTGAASTTATTGSGRSPLLLPSAPAVPWRLGHTTAGKAPTTTTTPPDTRQTPARPLGATGPPYTFFIAEGGSAYLESPTTAFMTAGHPIVTINAGGHHGAGWGLNFSFVGPDGMAPTVGTYSNVTVNVDPQPGQPAMGVSYELTDGTMSSPLGTGTVTVDEYTTDVSGNTLSFSASWSVALTGGGSVGGEVRYSALARGTYQGLALVSTTGMDGAGFGEVAVGVPLTGSMTLENVGTAPLSIGAATIDGAAAADLSLTGDDCPATLAVDGTCTLQLSEDAVATGVRRQTIHVAAGVPGGSVHFERRSTAYNPLTVTIVGQGSVLTHGIYNSYSSCTAATSPCQTLMYADDQLTAQPAAGSTFGGWSGDCAGTGTCQVTNDAPRNATATFVSPVISGAPGVQAADGFYVFDDTTPGCTTHPCSPPPNPAIAVSPDEVVTGINGAIGFTDRASGYGVGVDATDFFADATLTQPDGDVRVLWDGADSRWYATDSGWDCTAGHIDLAVSSTADAFGAWTVYQWVEPSTRPAQVKLGMSGDKIVVGLGTQSAAACSNAGLPTSALVLDISDAMAAPATLPSSQIALPGTDPLPVSDQPLDDAYVVTADTAPGGDPFRLVDLVTIQGLNGPGSATPVATSVQVTSIQPFQITDPFIGPDPTDAVWSAGHIWTMAVNTCTSNASWDCLRTDQLDVSDPAHPIVTDSFEVNNSGQDLMPGALAVAADGTVFVTYSTRSGTGSSTYVVTHRPGDSPGTHRAPAVIATGGPAVSPSRWSAQFEATVDPTDPHVVWQITQVDTSDNGWLTWASALRGDATTAPTGTAVLHLGRPTTFYLHIAVDPAPSPTSGATMMRISDSPTMSSYYESPIAFRWSWQLDDQNVGGSKATGPRHVYIEWGDGAGDWSSPIASDAVSDRTVAPLTNMARYQPGWHRNRSRGPRLAARPCCRAAVERGSAAAQARCGSYRPAYLLEYHPGWYVDTSRPRRARLTCPGRSR